VADGTIKELSARIGEALVARSLTIAAAESCTGGELCAALTLVPGSSAYFLGGVVAYDNAVKTRELRVPAALIASKGAVSEEVADAMGDGVRQRFGAAIGVGTTGIAGPGGGTAEKPVGTVYVGLSFPGGRRVSRLSLSGDREAVRRETVIRALEELLAVVSGGRRETK
jgi:nicotinamide-nucleotide amidase